MPDHHISINILISRIDPSCRSSSYSAAPLLLFQAVHPLLTKSTAPDGPKFLLLGTKQGSIGGMESYYLPMAIYGASKALAHYFIRKIHIEHEKEGIVAWVVDPG